MLPPVSQPRASEEERVTPQPPGGSQPEYPPPQNPPAGQPPYGATPPGPMNAGHYGGPAFPQGTAQPGGPSGGRAFPLLLFGVLVPSVLITVIAVVLAFGARIGSSDASPSEGENPFVALGTEDPQRQEPDCLEIVEPSLDSLVQRSAPCGSRESDYEVVRSNPVDSLECPSESYSRIAVDGRGYCLMPDVRADDCMREGSPDELRTKVDCSAVEADLRVAEVLPTTDGQCPVETEWYMDYPVPGRTLCLTPVSAI